MKHIITPEEVRQYGRAMSAHVDKKTLEALIQETENLDIRPALGVTFYQEVVNTDGNNEYINLLLEGGYYNDGHAHLQGLKAAAAYYVQAKLVKSNDNQITRFGMMQKDNEYGYRPSLAERTDAYNDLCSIADQYLQDVLDYIAENSEHLPCQQSSAVRNNRTIYRIIGE